MENEAKPRRSRLTLRTYRHPESTGHSYIAGTTDLGGLSERLTTLLPYDKDQSTLRSLRPIIEHHYLNGMNRRTMLYQELLSFMLDLENPYSYSTVQATSYRFGIFRDKTLQVIPIDREDDLITEWISDPLQQDLIVIPQTQIHPKTDALTPLLKIKK